MKHRTIKLFEQQSLYAAAVALVLTVGCSNPRSSSNGLYQTNYGSSVASQISTAGQLPTQPQLNMSAAAMGTNTPTATAPQSTSNTQNTLTSSTLSQIAYDFGDMNSCYQNTLRRGQQLLSQGSATDSIFEQAGQQLVQCYNQILTYRAQQLQAYQQQQRVYQQNMAYVNQLLLLLAQRSQQNGQGQLVRPPGR